MTTAEQLQLLIDRAEISDVVHRYATGLDTHDWPLLRSIFTDEIDVDMSSIGMRPGRMKADDWVESARVLFAGFDATQHLSANHVHDIRGDEATCTSYMRAEHFVLNNEGENYYTMGGYYVDELVRTPGRLEDPVGHAERDVEPREPARTAARDEARPRTDGARLAGGVIREVQACA